MDIFHTCCAGLDVHKEKVVVCVRRLAAHQVHQEIRTFRTETNALLDLADWLTDQGVTHVALESTGVYWKPIWNLFEGVFEMLLINAEHIKAVPGRKTDVKDCQWIAQLLQHGLLKPSFIPDKPVRQLRDLTRQRVQLVRQKVQVGNRIQKTLEDANIKLASVASDVLGVSGRDMLRAIVAGERDPIVLADLARQRLRAKIPQLREALCGEIEGHHRFLLGMLLEQVDFLEGQIGKLTTRIAEVLPTPFEAAIERLDTVPGIDRKAAENIVAELGVDLKTFASPAQLASWAGVCPGNNESAGKRRSSRTTQGNAWLRVVLVQCAWAASHSEGTYLQALYRRLAGRRGKKRALVAVAHRLLHIVYAVLKKGEVYRELGTDYQDKRPDKGRQAARLVARLERLGLKVTVTEAEPEGAAEVAEAEVAERVEAEWAEVEA
jgi:transposase